MDSSLTVKLMAPLPSTPLPQRIEWNLSSLKEGEGENVSTPQQIRPQSPSPSKHAAMDPFETPPPMMKRQRLFSPSSPSTPDKFPDSFRSPARPLFSPISYLDSSCDEMMAGGVDDVMIRSPPHLERLQLLDYPRSPLSITRRSRLNVEGDSAKAYSRIKVARSGPSLRRRRSRGTNINPFTPSELRSRSLCYKTSTTSPKTKKLALRESNISRYKEEFHEVCLIGSGSFGTVHKCINRLDGCVYALKRSHKPVVGSANEAAALREVCAHAVFGSHPHLVRYYSAWAEDNHVLIQSEFCDGGSLSSKISANQYEGKSFKETELKCLLRHVLLGLQYIHSMSLVHLDIKPDNIFISSQCDPPPASTPSSMEAISEDSTVHIDGRQFVYKIGDMGLVSSTCDPHMEEGDCRYLPKEILQENYSHLPKADIFSLGLTVFHAGSGVDLPKNGDDWHGIRDGNLPHLESCSPAFNKLLKVMTHSDPAERPTATKVLTKISTSTQKTRAQLCKELTEEKFKNQLLQRELQEAKQKNSISTGGKRLLSGPKLNRSMSIT